MKFQTLRDAMRAAEIARAELENAMVKFETAMAEMNKALDDRVPVTNKAKRVAV